MSAGKADDILDIARCRWRVLDGFECVLDGSILMGAVDCSWLRPC